MGSPTTVSSWEGGDAVAVYMTVYHCIVADGADNRIELGGPSGCVLWFAIDALEGGRASGASGEHAWTRSCVICHPRAGWCVVYKLCVRVVYFISSGDRVTPLRRSRTK